MSFTMGAQLTCDRCGATAFVKWQGGGEEWTRSDHPSKYEEAPGWQRVEISSAQQIQNLCPECYQDFERLIDNFKRRPARDVDKEVRK